MCEGLLLDMTHDDVKKYAKSAAKKDGPFRCLIIECAGPWCGTYSLQRRCGRKQRDTAVPKVKRGILLLEWGLFARLNDFPVQLLMSSVGIDFIDSLNGGYVG